MRLCDVVAVRRASGDDVGMVAGVPIVIVEYEPAWMSLFGALGLRLRAELGEVALRIDHIGSTAVRGLAAKPRSTVLVGGDVR